MLIFHHGCRGRAIRLVEQLASELLFLGRFEQVLAGKAAKWLRFVHCPLLNLEILLEKYLLDTSRLSVDLLVSGHCLILRF